VGGGLNGDELVYPLLISLQADPRASWGRPIGGALQARLQYQPRP
jgi:hypothetical protein